MYPNQFLEAFLYGLQRNNTLVHMAVPVNDIAQIMKNAEEQIKQKLLQVLDDIQQKIRQAGNVKSILIRLECYG